MAKGMYGAFVIDPDPDKHPDQVQKLTELLDARLAEHPVRGVFVQLMPHPGWRAPKDFADAIIPAEKINAEPHEGFGAG